ncbi:hypothetical protein [Jiella mangrovi]|uniref:DUF4164 family protein n=1 Tax=Jiella mangrovi TaxID=2821407 RepID=A0ABS4BMX2_9HYPH|nr:hypothetical protein [Jiella mangrovi]MBP0618086.1 hypothetical protein [Jiella mangrovi]
MAGLAPAAESVGVRANVARLEKSLTKLEIDNKRLREDIRLLERQVSENTAQLNLLVGFVRDALNARFDQRVEESVGWILGDRDRDLS